MNTIQVESDGTGSNTKILLNGEPMPGVTKIEFVIDGEQESLAVVKVSMYAHLELTVKNLEERTVVEFATKPE